MAVSRVRRADVEDGRRVRRIDLLFNNAGKANIGDARALTVADWHHLVDIDPGSAFLMLRAVHLVVRDQYASDRRL